MDSHGMSWIVMVPQDVQLLDYPSHPQGIPRVGLHVWPSKASGNLTTGHGITGGMASLAPTGEHRGLAESK
jgi:hypothetical protein